jgi:transcriptional regulator with XRE-family HTH domain
MKLSDLRSAEAVHQEDMADDPGYRKEYLKSRFANQVAVTIIRWRTEHDLTQAKLADLLGMRQPNIARLESGEHTPSLETLGRISSQLGIAFSIDIDPEDGVSLGESRPAGGTVEDAVASDERTEPLERIRAIRRSLRALQVVADDQARQSETPDPVQGGRSDFERALAAVLERFRERGQLRRPGSWKAADVVGLLDSGQEVLFFEVKSPEDLHTLSVTAVGDDTRSEAARR